MMLFASKSLPTQWSEWPYSLDMFSGLCVIRKETRSFVTIHQHKLVKHPNKVVSLVVLLPFLNE